jgi:hypothetical protein
MEWKEISEFPNIKISNEGQIYSKISKRLQKLTLNNTGYYLVSVKNDKGEYKPRLVHRLVAKAFLDNKNNYKCINHKDSDKLNNHAYNLEWCTKAYNNRHSVDMGLSNTKKPILAKNLKTKKVLEYESAREASKDLNIDYKQISDNCRGRQHTCHGYKFSFKEDVTTSS